MTKTSSTGDKKQQRHHRVFTVAQLRDFEEDHVVIAFYEYARFYRLDRDNPAFDRSMERLRDAHATGGSVKVELASPEGELLLEVLGK